MDKNIIIDKDMDGGGERNINRISDRDRDKDMDSNRWIK
jgi:hypothetical protein